MFGLYFDANVVRDVCPGLPLKRFAAGIDTQESIP